MKDERARAHDGCYTFEGNWDRLCVCGHALGHHTASAPHECLGPDGCGPGDRCECLAFVPAKERRRRA